MTPFISPDGDYLIYCSELELRISFRNNDGTWSELKSLGSLLILALSSARW